jgi:hypothetical protein
MVRNQHIVYEEKVWWGVCECGTRGTLVTLRVEEKKRRESGEYWGIKPGDRS